MSDGILKFSNAEGVTAFNRYNNFNTNYGDFGALQRIAYASPGGTQVVNFQNIPATFQDLMIVVNGRASGTSNITGANTGTATSMGYCQVNLNNEASTVFSQTNLYGNGATTYSNRYSNTIPWLSWLPNSNATSGVFGSITFHLLNYANTSTFKPMLTRSALDLNGSGATLLSAGLWRSTAAINYIQVYVTGPETWVSGSTVALYGVRASAA